MTDTVNVPREAVVAALKEADRPFRQTLSDYRYQILAEAALAAAPKAEPVDAEVYLKEAISSSPQPLPDLGEFLSSVLDEDHWKTADRFLLAIATSQPEAPKVEQEPVAWRWQTPIPHVGDGTRWGWTFASHASTPPASINAEPPYTSAPASDELLEVEAWAVEMTAKHGNPNGTDYEQGQNDMGVRVVSYLRSLRPKHKGPQS